MWKLIFWLAAEAVFAHYNSKPVKVTGSESALSYIISTQNHWTCRRCVCGVDRTSLLVTENHDLIVKLCLCCLPLFQCLFVHIMLFAEGDSGPKLTGSESTFSTSSHLNSESLDLHTLCLRRSSNLSSRYWKSWFDSQIVSVLSTSVCLFVLVMLFAEGDSGPKLTGSESTFSTLSHLY